MTNDNLPPFGGIGRGGMRATRLPAWVIALLAGAGPFLSSPAVADDVATCKDASGDAAIAACTRVSRDRGASTRIRAAALSNRGVEYKAKGDLDRAIVDYSEAIRLDPKFAPPYSNRGNAYKPKDDLDRAIADLTVAIRLDPKNEAANAELKALGGAR
jgi:tetratricopeptide (TPR) repeat protein